MVNISNITKVYNGRIGCMCGCKGKYSYTARGAAEDGPGYDVSNSVNERSVKIIAKRVLTHPMAKQEGENIVYVEDRVKGRIQVVFYKGA